MKQSQNAPMTVKQANHLISAIRELTVAIKTLKQDPVKPSEPETFASTTEIQQLTQQYFHWRPLKEYCQAFNLPIHKVEINGLEINSYPSTVW